MKIFLGILLLFTQFNLIASEKNLSLLGWVGFWNQEMLIWAENENRLLSLCPKSLKHEEQIKCKVDQLSEKHWTIPVYKDPNTESSKMGEIIISIKPGKPFYSSFKSPQGEIIPFETDLYDLDWGYGPYFHQTILEQRGEWVKIPLVSITSAWINPRVGIQNIDVFTIRKGIVYELESESIVILGIEKNTMSYRLENVSDLWCDEGNPPKLPPDNRKTIKIKNLFDKDHLLLNIKYKRGC